MPSSHESLLARFSQGDRRALAAILTLVESGQAPPLPPLDAKESNTRIVGITGSGGAGKSTLVSALIDHLRKKNLRVAVLACDPSSPRTGGALLGDRIRARFDPADEGVFFRSLSTRGAAGGISAAVGPALPWLRRFGFDVVLVETVGIGQDQVAARAVVDTLLLLVTPQTGDEVQWDKAGVIEVADVVVVNKADLPGAARLRQQLEQSLSLSESAKSPSWQGSRSTQRQRVPVVLVTASTGEAVADLCDMLLAPVK